MASKLNTSIIAKIFILRTATLAKERYPAIKGFQWKFSYKNIRSEPCPWKNTYIHIHIYILVYSVFLYWTAGKSNWILPWWYLYARELFANMEFETTYYKKYMQRICMPVPREKCGLWKPRWVEPRRTFQNIKMEINSRIEQCRNWATREWQRDGQDWAKNPQTEA